MENPMSWGPVEKTIHKAFLEWENRPVGLCGWSLEMTIANALRQEGLVVDEV